MDKKYIHAKVREKSKYIQLNACQNNINYRFSTKLPINKENLDYVETHYEEIIELYKKHGKVDETIIKEARLQKRENNMFSIENYGWQVLKLESNILKENTYLRYEHVFRKHIISNIGDMSLSDFSPKIMKEIFANKLSYLSFSNKCIAVTILRKIFNYAISDEIFIKSNPTTSLKIRKKEYLLVKRNNKALSLNETLNFIEVLQKQKDNYLKLYFHIALLTGMRVNEILALQFSDLDMKNNCIHVDKTLANGKISTPKTKTSVREIEIIPFLKEKLQVILKDMQYGQLGLEYIFINNKGNFMNARKFANAFKSLLNRLKIETRTLYSTRHTFASIMLAYGEDLAWTSKMLGHNDIATTANHYVKYIKSNKQRGLFLYDEKNAG